MRYVKWGFWATLALAVFSFLHYTLPQSDIVRIVGSENRRIDVGDNALFWSNAEVGMANSTSRDVFFINAVYPDGSTMEYRNEDTGWGWPPYFKVNSFGLQTEAKEFQSSGATPIWVAVRHYGWRNQFFTIFPNAVSVRRVDGPDVTLIPWINITIFVFLGIILFMMRRVWLQFRERTIDPALDDAAETWEAVDARADAARDQAKGFFGRIGAWFASLGAKPKR
jgi:hypothetical protein